MANSELIKLLKLVAKNDNTNIEINDKSFNFKDLTIKQTSDGGTVVMIDGIPSYANDVEIQIKINGDVENITLGSGNIECTKVNGNVSSISGDINCSDIDGNVETTSGDISCLNVGGNVSSISGDIECSDISGNASTISGDIY